MSAVREYIIVTRDGALTLDQRWPVARSRTPDLTWSSPELRVVAGSRDMILEDYSAVC